MSNIDKDAIRELELYVTNDGELYRQRLYPAIQNLVKKHEKGIYIHERAITLYKYTVDQAAKKYCQEFGGIARQVFSLPVRWAVAKSLADHYKTEIELGNYTAN